MLRITFSITLGIVAFLALRWARLQENQLWWAVVAIGIVALGAVLYKTGVLSWKRGRDQVSRLKRTHIESDPDGR